MTSAPALLWSGLCLLAVAALLGFVQHRYRDRPKEFAEWRVVHAGGTTGAVQLLALAAVWHQFERDGSWDAAIAGGVIVATLGFFFGPLARVLRYERLGKVLIGVGAAAALPAYLALPLVLLF